MIKKTIFCLMLCGLALCAHAQKNKKQLFPDGTPVPAWFSDFQKVDVSTLGKKYVITDYGVKNDSALLQTDAIQRVIDLAASQGGGVIWIPKGQFLTGNLFFKQGTHLYVDEGAVLKGSNRVVHFKVLDTRMEGQNCKYVDALINADGLDGFVIAGKGTIDGDGWHYWEEFWYRRKWNPDCTNKDGQRPRLVFISNSCNVTVQDVRMINSPFWTNHLYKCHHVRYLDCTMLSPTTGFLKGPSTDALDLDVCHDVLVRGCHMDVNDDAVVLKGGKGTWADKDPNNGPNYNIIIERCVFGRTHGCLTMGSESLHDRNIVMRDCRMNESERVLWLKMRPDTPQHYEYIVVENITGVARHLLFTHPWMQFYNLEDRADMPLSRCNNVSFKHIDLKCTRGFVNVKPSDKYVLSDFSFEHIRAEDVGNLFDASVFERLTVNDVTLNGVPLSPVR